MLSTDHSPARPLGGQACSRGRRPRHASAAAQCRHRQRWLAVPAGVAQCAATPTQQQQKQKQTRVVIVGGGVGGLALAGQLARSGLQVTLLEQNEQVGGRAQSVTTPKGFRFDTGPSLLLLPDKYEQAFEHMGASCTEFFEMRRVEGAAYRVFYEGGGALDMLYDEPGMAAQLETVEPGAGDAYRRWLKAAGTSLRVGVDAFIDRNTDSLPAMLLDSAPRLLPLLLGSGSLDLRDLLGNHHARLGDYFRDPRLRSLFSFQDLYVGLSPYDAPAAFSLLAATELLDGVHYPMGGFGQVTSGLLQAAQRCGAEVRTGTRVASVDLSRDGSRVVGVTFEDSSSSSSGLQADYVIANRDLPLAYALVAGSQHAQQRAADLAERPYSAGIVEFCWSLGRQFDGLRHHNIFLSDEYEASWQRATSAGELRASPNFYVHAPGRTDPSAAPPGCDSLMVLMPVGNQQQLAAAGRRTDGAGYAEIVDAGRRRVFEALRRAGVGDLEPHVLEETVIAPPEWGDRYGLQHGAAFGLSHGLGQLAALRPSNQDEIIRGLFFVGASTRPGNGVPLALIGARLTAEKVLLAAKKDGAMMH